MDINSQDRLKFEIATRQIIGIQGCAVVTGMAVWAFWHKEGQESSTYGYNRFKRAFEEYEIEIIPHMDGYLVRKR